MPVRSVEGQFIILPFQSRDVDLDLVPALFSQASGIHLKKRHGSNWFKWSWGCGCKFQVPNNSGATLDIALELVKILTIEFLEVLSEPLHRDVMNASDAKKKQEPWYIWVGGIGLVALLIAAFLFWMSWRNARELGRVPESITLSALLARGPASDVRVTISEFEIGPISSSVGKANSKPTETYFAIAPFKHPGGSAPRAVIVNFNRGLTRQQIIEIAQKQALTGTFDYQRSVSGTSADMLKENYPDADPSHIAWLSVNADEAGRLTLVAWILSIIGGLLFLTCIVVGMIKEPAEKASSKDNGREKHDDEPRHRRTRDEEYDEDEPRGKRNRDNNADEGESDRRSKRGRHDPDEDHDDEPPRRRPREW